MNLAVAEFAGNRLGAHGFRDRSVRSKIRIGQAERTTEWSCASGSIQKPVCRTFSIIASPEEEVQQVLSRTGEEFPGRDRSRIRLGQTEAGRYLQVVYVPDNVGESAFVVTAFDLTPKAKRALRRRQRRKKK